MKILHKPLAPEDSGVNLELKNFIAEEYNPSSPKCINHATLEIFV